MLIRTLPNDILSNLIAGLIRGEYHLLLGAGASVGCIGGDQRPLPTGKELAVELVKRFGVATTEDDTLDLRTVYEAVESLLDSQGRDRREYLRQRFTNCEPGWHTLLPNLQWRRIWTLNIDDTVQNAYTRSPASRQAVQRYSWTALYREPNRAAGELQLIHLHGAADRLQTADTELVFSVLEYLQASSARHAWHRVFGDEFLQRPFIVVGATLADEYDLADVLRRGNNSLHYAGRPSIIVMKRFTSLQSAQFRKWGLIPIGSSASEFFEEISSLTFQEEARSGSLFPGRTAVELPIAAQTFLQQFRLLKLDQGNASSDKHDFYGGGDPTWSDILRDDDAVFDITRQTASLIEQETNIRLYSRIYG
jgi:hypothetical protein